MEKPEPEDVQLAIKKINFHLIFKLIYVLPVPNSTVFENKRIFPHSDVVYFYPEEVKKKW
jgi:hypothetical protein